MEVTTDLCLLDKDYFLKGAERREGSELSLNGDLARLCQTMTYLCAPGLLGAALNHGRQASAVAGVGDTWVARVIKGCTNL